MNTLLANGWHGPGPWILLVPFVWVAVVAGVVTVLRRSGLRGPGWRRGPWAAAWGPGAPAAAAGGAAGPYRPAPTPVEVLNRRYADGEIDEYEYRARLSVLTETEGGAAGGATGE
jgi:putative membrane protein